MMMKKQPYLEENQSIGPKKSNGGGNKSPGDHYDERNNKFRGASSKNRDRFNSNNMKGPRIMDMMDMPAHILTESFKQPYQSFASNGGSRYGQSGGGGDQFSSSYDKYDQGSSNNKFEQSLGGQSFQSGYSKTFDDAYNDFGRSQNKVFKRLSGHRRFQKRRM